MLVLELSSPPKKKHTVIVHQHNIAEFDIVILILICNLRLYEDLQCNTTTGSSDISSHVTMSKSSRAYPFLTNSMRATTTLQLCVDTQPLLYPTEDNSLTPQNTSCTSCSHDLRMG